MESRTPIGILRARERLANEERLAALHAASVERAAAYRGKTGLKLHVACGPEIKEGWVNIDLKPEADLNLDLREPLPFDDGSVQIIYGEHFFEHLDYPGAFSPLVPAARRTFWVTGESPEYPSDAMSFLRECLRVLAPGGVLSLSVPDAEMCVMAYATRDSEYFSTAQHPKWCATRMHSVNFTFRQGDEHRYAYDFETLAMTVEAAGFPSCVRRSFDPALDLESRRNGSLYIEARRP